MPSGCPVALDGQVRLRRGHREGGVVGLCRAYRMMKPTRLESKPICAEIGRNEEGRRVSSFYLF